MSEKINRSLNEYVKFFYQEKGSFEVLEKQIQNSENLIDRKNMNGHVTASGLVLSPEGKVLLIFHKAGKRFQQPGGHIDTTDSSVVSVALREVKEETGLCSVTLHPWHEKHPHPINIDSHYIAPRPEKNEGGHYHHDFMYLFVTCDTKITLQQEGVGDFRWIDPGKDKKSAQLVATSIQKAIDLDVL